MAKKGSGKNADGKLLATLGKHRNDHKNAAAVALGKLGGMKGGVARAESLSASRRRQIAKIAAAARWQKSN